MDAAAYANDRLWQSEPINGMTWLGAKRPFKLAHVPPLAPAAKIHAPAPSRLAFAAKISMVPPHFAPEGGKAASAPPRPALRT